VRGRGEALRWESFSAPSSCGFSGGFDYDRRFRAKKRKKSEEGKRRGKRKGGIQEKKELESQKKRTTIRGRGVVRKEIKKRVPRLR